jgi:general secretion pathway protein G
LLVLSLVTQVGANEVPCARVQTELRALDAALEMYRIEHGHYPAHDDWFGALQKAGMFRAELDGKDRWGHAYSFVPAQGEAPFDLRSLGPDGVRDTADDQIKANGWKWTGCKSSGGC